MTFQAKVRKWLRDNNIESTAAAARKFGLTHRIIDRALKSRELPKGDVALKIAATMGVSLDWLFDASQSYPPPSRNGLQRADLQDPAVRKFLSDVLQQAQLVLPGTGSDGQEGDKRPGRSRRRRKAKAS